jgi:hypothetical protein
MPSIFVLQHFREREDGVDDVKFIGVYSSRENAQAAEQRLRRVSGFCDEPEGFHIDEYLLDQDHWLEGFAAVAFAEHEQPNAT